MLQKFHDRQKKHEDALISLSKQVRVQIKTMQEVSEEQMETVNQRIAGAFQDVSGRLDELNNGLEDTIVRAIEDHVPQKSPEETLAELRAQREPPPALPEMKSTDLTKVESAVAELRNSLTYLEQQETALNQAVEALTNKVTKLDRQIKSADDEAIRGLEELAKQGTTIDAATMLEAMRATKREIVGATVGREEFEPIPEKMSALDHATGKFMNETQFKVDLLDKNTTAHAEEVAKNFAIYKRIIGSKLDSVDFNDEIDQVVSMINALSSLRKQTGKGGADILQDQIKQFQSNRRESVRAGLSEEQRILLEGVSEQFPLLQNRQKQLMKQLEMLNIETLKQQVGELQGSVSKKLGRPDMDRIQGKLDEAEDIAKKCQTVLKKFTHQQERTNDNNVQAFEKQNHANAEFEEKVSEHAKKLEFFDSMFNNMKKRLSEMSTQVKNSALSAGAAGRGRSETEDDAQKKEMLEALEEQMKGVKQTIHKFQQQVETDLQQLAKKAEKEHVQTLEEKMDRRFKLVQKELKNLKADGPKESNKSEAAHNQSSRLSLHETIPSPNAHRELKPTLPFMKQGERISKYGPGYSKTLKYSVITPEETERLMQSPSLAAQA